mmetsp:Transcript_66197/g.91630  ORF Transcript_66197/g.91630 Transcript_66197/m.91630 type:complete len:275 (+) Transcript_66197:2-826(+)
MWLHVRRTTHWSASTSSRQMPQTCGSSPLAQSLAFTKGSWTTLTSLEELVLLLWAGLVEPEEAVMRRTFEICSSRFISRASLSPFTERMRMPAWNMRRWVACVAFQSRTRPARTLVTISPLGSWSTSRPNSLRVVVLTICAEMSDTSESDWLRKKTMSSCCLVSCSSVRISDWLVWPLTDAISSPGQMAKSRCSSFQVLMRPAWISRTVRLPTSICTRTPTGLVPSRFTMTWISCAFGGMGSSSAFVIGSVMLLTAPMAGHKKLSCAGWAVLGA